MNSWHFLLLAPLTACEPGHIGSAPDSGQPSKVDSADTSDSGPMGGGPCGESGICDIVASLASADCGGGPVPEQQLQATATMPGTVEVVHRAHSQGCCPSFDLSAELNLREGETIQVQYQLYDDFCDCICDLDLSYRLSGIPAGSWGLAAEDQQIEITVE